MGRAVAILVWLFGMPSLLEAHGGSMTSKDLQPIAISGALALTSYWIVMLWPKRKNVDEPPGGSVRKPRVNRTDPKSPFNSQRYLRHLKQVPQLGQLPRVGGYAYGPDSVSNG